MNFRSGLFLLIFFTPLFKSGQLIPDLKKNGKALWEKKEWRKANTARFSFLYMNKQMRESIRLMNLARVNGSKFAEIYIEPIQDKTEYENSLIRTLKNQKTKTLLRPSVNLKIAAGAHAFLSGLTGATGHKGFNARMAIVQPFNWGKQTGENCDYGSKKALQITLDLLIDRGVPGYGHRKNILDKNFTRVGASRFWHKEYGYNAVFDYSSATWVDFLLHVKPDIRQYGLNIAISQISARPMLDMGLAYFINHLGTTDMMMTLNYQKGILNNKTDAVSFYLGSGYSTELLNHFLLGVKFQSFFNAGQPDVNNKSNLYIQPELSWFTIIRFFHDGQLFDINDTERSALYRFSYGYNFGAINAVSNQNIFRHNFSISRFICIASSASKKSK